MERKVIGVLVGLAIPMIVFSYVSYIDMNIRAASELQWERNYEESNRRLERLLPYVWTDMYRGQVMYKLGFNYEHLGEYEKMRSIGEQMSDEFPNVVWGYYGLRFQAQYLRDVDRKYLEAIELYKQILDQIEPRRPDDALGGLRERVLFELAGAYHKADLRAEMDATIEILRRYSPQSIYLERLSELD